MKPKATAHMDQRSGLWHPRLVRNLTPAALAEMAVDQAAPDFRAVDYLDVPGRLPTPLESMLAALPKSARLAAKLKADGIGTEQGQVDAH